MDGECIEKLFKYFLFYVCVKHIYISSYVIFQKFTTPVFTQYNENNFHYIVRVLKAQFVK